MSHRGDQIPQGPRPRAGPSSNRGRGYHPPIPSGTARPTALPQRSGPTQVHGASSDPPPGGAGVQPAVGPSPASPPPEAGVVSGSQQEGPAGAPVVEQGSVPVLVAPQPGGLGGAPVVPDMAAMRARLDELESSVIHLQEAQWVPEGRVEMFPEGSSIVETLVTLCTEVSELRAGVDDIRLVIRGLVSRLTKLEGKQTPSRRRSLHRRPSLATVKEEDDSGGVSSDDSESPQGDEDQPPEVVTIAPPSLGAAVTGLTELDPPRDEFAKVVSYRHYRLLHTSGRYDSRVAGRLSRQVRAMTHTFRVEKFTGEDPIRILEFLRNFRDSANHNMVSEAAAARLMPYFLAEPAASEVNARLSQWETDTKPPLYPRLVAWMLKEYATPRVLRDAYSAVVTLSQDAQEDEQAFALRLRSAANRTGNVFSDKALCNVFLDGLSPAVSAMVTELKDQQTNLTDLQALASNMGRALRASNPPSGSKKGQLERPSAPAARASTGRASPTRSAKVPEKAALVQGEEYSSDPQDDPEWSGASPPGSESGDYGVMALYSDGSEPWAPRGPYARGPRPSPPRFPPFGDGGPSSSGGSPLGYQWTPPSSRTPSPARGGGRSTPLCDFCKAPGHFFRTCPQLAQLPESMREHFLRVREQNVRVGFRTQPPSPRFAGGRGAGGYRTPAPRAPASTPMGWAPAAGRPPARGPRTGVQVPPQEAPHPTGDRLRPPPPLSGRAGSGKKSGTGHGVLVPIGLGRQLVQTRKLPLLPLEWCRGLRLWSPRLVANPRGLRKYSSPAGASRRKTRTEPPENATGFHSSEGR